jgi:hypothetical protein
LEPSHSASAAVSFFTSLLLRRVNLVTAGAGCAGWDRLEARVVLAGGACSGCSVLFSVVLVCFFVSATSAMLMDLAFQASFRCLDRPLVKAPVFMEAIVLASVAFASCAD